MIHLLITQEVSSHPCRYSPKDRGWSPAASKGLWDGHAGVGVTSLSSGDLPQTLPAPLQRGQATRPPPQPRSAPGHSRGLSGARRPPAHTFHVAGTRAALFPSTTSYSNTSSPCPQGAPDVTPRCHPKQSQGLRTTLRVAACLDGHVPGLNISCGGPREGFDAPPALAGSATAAS